MGKFFSSPLGKPVSFIQLLNWLFLAAIMAVGVGSATALFLFCLEKVTQWHWQNGWLLYLLPLAGVGIYFLYKGKNEPAARGNGLIVQEIHHTGGGLPPLMGPLVFLATLITHLFGGSAGREGTAVQMGASLGDWLARFRMADPNTKKLLLAIGMSAGFGAVFGTPLAAVVFALEMIGTRRCHFMICLPLLLSGMLADKIVLSLGIQHDQYRINGLSLTALVDFDGPGIQWIILAGIVFGIAAFIFSFSTGIIKKWSLKFLPKPWMLPALGGILIILLAQIPGNHNYLGLGARSATDSGISILSAFQQQGADTWSWLWKIIFTAITLGFGFKGGEVTPLFFIGACLGNTIAAMAGLPVDWMAALGLLAVFAAGLQTPVTGIVLGMELFALAGWPYYLMVCLLASFISKQGRKQKWLV